MRIASRKSKLALWQANYMVRLLHEDCEIIKVTTKGDKITDVPLHMIGDKGLFVKEVDNSVAKGKADISVHSLKDMPTDARSGLILAAVPKRAMPYEALLSRYRSVMDLPYKASVATSSIRRASEILRSRPDLVIRPLRGNVDTRVSKAKDFDAVVLAEAGLTRLGYSKFKRISADRIIPAAGQGALGIVARADDKEVLKRLERVDHRATRLEIEAERALMMAIEGGCQIPAGALARYRGGALRIRAFIGSLDGSRSIRGVKKGAVKGPVAARRLGERLGKELLKAGGAVILKELRECQEIG